MRDYQYLWMPAGNTLVASGIEFSDLNKVLSNRMLILLKHDAEGALFDSVSRFEYIHANNILENNEDIYSWGDFKFIICESAVLPEFTKDVVKDILYYAHSGEWSDELQKAGFVGGVAIHDNGWYLKYVGNENFLGQIVGFEEKQELQSLREGMASLVIGGVTKVVEGTEDIDAILNEYC